MLVSTVPPGSGASRKGASTMLSPSLPIRPGRAPGCSVPEADRRRAVAR